MYNSRKMLKRGKNSLSRCWMSMQKQFRKSDGRGAGRAQKIRGTTECPSPSPANQTTIAISHTGSQHAIPSNISHFLSNFLYLRCRVTSVLLEVRQVRKWDIKKGPAVRQLQISSFSERKRNCHLISSTHYCLPDSSRQETGNCDNFIAMVTNLAIATIYQAEGLESSELVQHSVFGISFICHYAY